MGNIEKDTAKIQSHHLDSPPLPIFTALKMQGGSVCHITHTNTTQTLQNTTRQAEFPNLTLNTPAEENSLFILKASVTLLWFLTPVMQQDVQGCLTFQTTAEC